jgi:hypothetical protein
MKLPKPILCSVAKKTSQSISPWHLIAERTAQSGGSLQTLSSSFHCAQSHSANQMFLGKEGKNDDRDEPHGSQRG